MRTETFDFNSHAHVERDVLLRGYFPPVSNFNSHAHVERDISPTFRNSGVSYFNSHAHVERDCRIVWVKTMPAISTHTLTWSVTTFVGAQCPLEINFNSHAHVERDL